MISEKLSGAYTKLEDKYFDVLDFFDGKGLPVYTYSDFFEEKGIPSFIVTIAILFALIILMGFLITGPSFGAGEVTIYLKDSVTNQSLTGVNLKIYDSSQNILFNGTANNGQKIPIVSLPQGTALRIVATKDGYHQKGEETIVGAENRAEIYLDKAFVGITASLRITDAELGTKITDAVVSARYGDAIYNFYVDGNGIYKKDTIPEGETLTISISADGYNTVNQSISFFRESTKDITLTPSATGYVGIASVIVHVTDTFGAEINDAEVTIYNKENQVILVKSQTANGIVSGQIQTGVPLKTVVKKDGFITYDSDAIGDSFALRKKENRIEVVLQDGGNEINVNTITDLGLNISGVTVNLYDLTGAIIDSAISDGGSTRFKGINDDQNIIITAYKEGYLPARTKINTKNTQLASLILKETNSSNSTRLDIFTINPFGDSVAGAKIEINHFIDGMREPYGITDLSTSVGGYANVIVESSKAYEVIAQNSIYEGKTDIELKESITDTKVYIKMNKKANVFELELKDIYGNRLFGTARISALNGDILFDGNIESSSIYFNKYDNELVDVEIETLDGNIFKTNLVVQGKLFDELIVYDRGSDALLPSIEFIGIENENGDTVQGITPGAFYFAKFSISWPIASNNSGVHFRSGSDNEIFSDSENFAIFDLILTGAEKTFSYSFRPTPAPGDEGVDRSNAGLEGEANKWVEGILSEPRGTYVAKVKIRASEFTAGKVELRYRAWSLIEDEIYRLPVDEELLNNSFTEEKQALYADTLVQSITIYEALPECSEGLCVSYKFIDKEDNYYDLGNFEAITGEVYALETEFTSTTGDYLQVNLSTDSNVSFIGTQSNNFNFMSDTGYINAKEATTTVSLTANGKQTTRFYFVAQSDSTNLIKFSATGENEIQKEIAFNSAKEKEMIIELSTKKVDIGKNFTVKVLTNNLSGINNALVKIINKKGEVVKSIAGNNNDGLGKDGLYRIQNDLVAGIYIVNVSAKGYLTKEEAILVTTSEILSVSEVINLKMSFDEKRKTVNLEIENKSEFDIKDVTITAQESADFIVTTPTIASLAKGKKQNVILTVDYLGSSDSADESIEITVTGLIEGTYLVKESSVLNVTYNRTLEQSCLELKPGSIKISLIGQNGSNTTETIKAKNNCEIPVYLTKSIEEKTRKSAILVDTTDISLQPGQSKDITISVTNYRDLSFLRNETFNFEITFDSNYLTKRLNVSVELINPQIALSYPGQVSLFLAQDKPSSKAIATQPIFVTNVSEFPVEAIKFVVDKDYLAGNVKISVETPDMVSLEASQGIMPPKVVFAEASGQFAEPVNATITITGKIGNLNNRIGQRDQYDYMKYLNEVNSLANYKNNSTGYASSNQTLGAIKVIAFYSGFNCLKVSAVDELAYNLSAEGLGRTKTISVQNDCAEPVRILDVRSSSTNLGFSIPGIVISPGQVSDVPLGVSVFGNNLKLVNYPITLRGLTTISQTPIEASDLKITVFSGVNFNEEFSKSKEGITAIDCATNTEITIDLPKDATGIDCENGYCDAWEAGQFIAKKLDTAIKKAESQAYSAQKTNEALSCIARGYCTFAQIGTQKTEFDMYLKNDNVGIEVLEDAFYKDGKTSTGFTGLGLSDYRFEMGYLEQQVLIDSARAGYGRRIIVDDSFNGCGYYKVTIDGIFPINADGVDFGMPILTISASRMLSEQGRINTKECVTSIENISNFVLEDEEYTLNNTGGTWLTNIEVTNNSLKDIAKNLSEKLFKTENRVGTGNGNKIILKEGASSDELAKVCLIDGERKIIEVSINSQINTLNETTKAGFISEVTKLITNAINGNFGQNCLEKIGDKYSCVVLKDTSNLDNGLALTLDSKDLIMGQTNGCVSGEVSSNWPEKVTFNINEFEENKEFANISQIIISKETGEELYKINFDGTDKKNITLNEEITLENIANRKEKKFSQRIIVCAKSSTGENSETTYLHANDVQFILKAENKSAGNRQTDDGDGLITIRTSSLHPDDLIEILKTKKSLFQGKTGDTNPFYFTIMWAGEPTKLTDFKTYYDSTLETSGRKTDITLNTDGTIANTEAGYKIKEESRSSALGSYMLGCTIVSAACNAGTGVGGAITNTLFDCALPAITVLGADVTKTFSFMKGFYNFVEDIPLIGNMFQIRSTLPEAKSLENLMPTMAATGGTFGGVQRIVTNSVKYWNGGTLGELNPNLLDWTAEQAKSSFKTDTTDILRQTIPSLDLTNPTKATTAFIDDYSQTLSDTFKKELKESYLEHTKRNYKLGSTPTIAPEDAQKLVNEALEKTYAKGNLEFFNSGNTRMADLLTEAKITNLTPNQVQAKLSGKLGEVAQNFDITNGINKIFDEKLVGTYDDALDALGTNNLVITSDRLKATVHSQIDDAVTEITKARGISASDDITKKIIADATSAIDDTFYDTLANSSKTTLDAGAGRELVQREIQNKTKRKISETVKRTLQNNDDLFRLAQNQLDEIGSTITKELQGKVKVPDIKKRSKLQNLISGKMIGSLARGVGCGIASNMVGMYAYNNTIKTKIETSQKDSDILPTGELVKGETYKLIVENQIGIGGLKSQFFLVSTTDEKKEMQDALSKKENKEITGTVLNWTKELNEKRPEERELHEYLLNIVISDLRIILGNEKEFTSDEIESIISLVTNTYTQKLIDKYSDKKGVNYGSKFATESWVAAIIAIENPTISEITREFNGDTTRLKELIEGFMRSIERDNWTPTVENIKNIYSDNKKVIKLYRLISAWEAAGSR